MVRGSGGEQTVWVHTRAERFERRTVRAQALSADRVALISGIAAGERVVTEGAGLLAQVRWEMFDFIIQTSLRQRLMVLGLSCFWWSTAP